ncbi:hypothetical protein ES705_48974 [subsurface metagenome]
MEKTFISLFFFAHSTVLKKDFLSNLPSLFNSLISISPDVNILTTSLSQSIPSSLDSLIYLLTVFLSLLGLSFQVGVIYVPWDAVFRNKYFQESSETISSLNLIFPLSITKIPILSVLIGSN